MENNIFFKVSNMYIVVNIVAKNL